MPSIAIELKREIARQILRQRDVVQRIVDHPARARSVPRARRRRPPRRPTNTTSSHILIAVAQDATPAQLAQASKLAHDIDDRAQHGEDFGTLAVTYSQSETALEGGSLGWRKGTELPTFLADVIARMQPGEVSEVMQTPSGFHIVKLNATRAAGGPQIVQQVHLRHILVKPTEIEDDATVQQKLTQHARPDRLGQGGFRGARQDLLAGSQLGGQWRRSGLDRAEHRSCRSSPPWSPSRSRKARSASRSAPSTAGTSCSCSGIATSTTPTRPPRERAFEALRDSRVEEATELWLQQIRDEAYVELRLYDSQLPPLTVAEPRQPWQRRDRSR